MQSIYPVQSEVVIPLNDDLEVHYSTFVNGETYLRPSGAYRMWQMQPFAEPQANPTIIEAYAAGVDWGCCEHVSVVTNGSALYTFQTATGDFVQTWTHGMHNVDGGLGYLPQQVFTRQFADDFTLCCVTQKLFHHKQAEYRFEVLTETKVLDADALFVHHCTGVREAETDWNVAAGQSIEVIAPDIVIVGYQI
ncbi:MAG: hypothetical protein CGW95_01510 [Phenylobacterium zucineum]|nr:MAG: hypothetical protein CGW95_01510 [Phenylobacterium zucineum]